MTAGPANRPVGADRRRGRRRRPGAGPGRRRPATPARRTADGPTVSVRASRLLAVLDTLDAAAVRRWCAGGLAALRRHQGEIDELNVYPVPDGDTGTNLVLTLTSA